MTESLKKTSTKEPVIKESIPKTPISGEKVNEMKETLIEKEYISKHRYLQTLIKKMVESRGYVASIEQPTPDGKDRVDVSLERSDKKIAVEICVTTPKEWEL